MARVGKRCISFRDFCPLGRCAGNSSPSPDAKTSKLPTNGMRPPDIHLTTIIDLREFCRKAGIHILQEIPLRPSGPGRRCVVRFAPNLRADSAIFVLEAGPAMTADPAPAP